jgi:hypothetical protein
MKMWTYRLRSTAESERLDASTRLLFPADQMGNGMTENANGPLNDDDIETVGGGSAGPDGDADGTDGTDADGTDGTDADGTDGTDADGTDGTDADGTDGTDADGTDTTDTDGTDS